MGSFEPLLHKSLRILHDQFNNEIMLMPHFYIKKGIKQLIDTC